MAFQITSKARNFLIIVAVFSALFGVKYLYDNGKIPGINSVESVVPLQADLPNVAEVKTTVVVSEATLPGVNPAGVGTVIRMLVWEWNAQMGLMYANGGINSTEKSLMAKYGVNLNLSVQNDSIAMRAEMVKFANELKDGNPQPANGAHFVDIMGDASGAFIDALNAQLKNLGNEYMAEIIGSAGFSRGEDKLMGLPEWVDNKQAMRGAFCAGVVTDGDWNIALKLAGDNKIKNNPDERTYDPEAINWVAAADYLDAAKKYNSGYSEDRPVVINGKRTGDMQHLVVNCVVTWTPGDVNIVHGKGGLVTIVSTKDYRWQMPHTIIGIKKWDADNRTAVDGMLAAMFEGADQVKAYPNALHRAAEISAKVYNEYDAAYWEKYFIGSSELDKQGNRIELGGSSVNNLADNLHLFGLLPGSTNLFAITYTKFAKIVSQQYPKLLPSFAPASEVINTSFLEDLAKKTPVDVKSLDLPTYHPDENGGNVVSKRSWSISFKTGSAEFSPESKKMLEELYTDIALTNLNVMVHGHTDSVGDPKSNLDLSERRAFAVKEYLEKKSSTNFPDGRVNIRPHGQENPIALNSTEDGRAKNRRVEIVLSKN